METDRWNERNGNYNQLLSEYGDGSVDQDVSNKDHKLATMPSTSTSTLLLPISSPPSICSSPSQLDYIEHPVSKLDTLVGVAIKYGVEVADVKKMNGLVTDLQMFALKSLQIPLPGRHPPSPSFPNGSHTTGHSCSNHNPTGYAHPDLFESFQSLKMKSSQQMVSPAMTSLQGYYGLKPTEKKIKYDSCKMALYKKPMPNSIENVSSGNSEMFDQSLGYHRKSRSLADGILGAIFEQSIVPVADAREGDSDKRNDKFIRRRQKSEANLIHKAELLPKEDNSSGGGFSSRTGKGLAQRQKSICRVPLTSDSESSGLNPVLIGLGDAFLVDRLSSVRKSSSTSNLKDR